MKDEAEEGKKKALQDLDDFFTTGGQPLKAKNPKVEGQNEEDPQRHLNIVKNKLTGWHGNVICELDYEIARYTA